MYRMNINMTDIEGLNLLEKVLITDYFMKTTRYGYIGKLIKIRNDFGWKTI